MTDPSITKVSIRVTGIYNIHTSISVTAQCSVSAESGAQQLVNGNVNITLPEGDYYKLTPEQIENKALKVLGSVFRKWSDATFVDE